jgi:hypothetical protein
MATLELPILPVHLYRYRSLKAGAGSLIEEIDSIKRGYLYCSPFRKMNDPMEGFFRSSSDLKGEETYKSVLSQIYAAKLNLGLASFTETNANELMWAHYANNYAGICVGYLAMRLMRGLGENVSLIRLAYGDMPPRISTRDANDPKKAAKRILSHKKDNWAYEREWRVLGDCGRVEYGNQNCVSRIYLGSRVTPEHRRTLVRELRDCDLKFFEMEVDGYGHKFSRFDP